MRGKIGPSGINDEAPKGRGKGGPVLLFEAENRPTGRGIHHILIYFPPSHLLVSNIRKKKLDLLTYKNQNFCFKTFTLSDLLTHTSARPGIFKDSLNIFKFYFSNLFIFTPSFSRFQISSEFKLFFFSANAGNKKESEGVVSLVRH